MGKHKKNKAKKAKREIVYRTKEQRQEEVKQILKQLSHFELTPRYEPVKELYKKYKNIHFCDIHICFFSSTLIINVCFSF